MPNFSVPAVTTTGPEVSDSSVYITAVGGRASPCAGISPKTAKRLRYPVDSCL